MAAKVALCAAAVALLSACAGPQLEIVEHEIAEEPATIQEFLTVEQALTPVNNSAEIKRYWYHADAIYPVHIGFEQATTIELPRGLQIADNGIVIDNAAFIVTAAASDRIVLTVTRIERSVRSHLAVILQDRVVRFTLMSADTPHRGVEIMHWSAR